MPDQTMKPDTIRTSMHAAPSPLRVLLVCHLFTMPYRAMRCAQAAGAEIFVLGNKGSSGFRASHYPQKLVLSEIPFDGLPTQAALDEINRYVVEFNINMVIPGDAPSTRTLAALKDRIHAPCFPLPDLRQFDTLNNKWIFTGICQALGIACPASRLFKTREELLHAIDSGEIALPSMAKALAMDGNHGIYHLDTDNARAIAKTIPYQPILIQDFIPGVDIGASVYCKNGVIHSHIIHQQKDSFYYTFDNDDILQKLSRFTEHSGISGVYNFDMRLTDDGRVYYLECNPRFFYKINLSMLAGVNFVQAGLPNGKTNPKAQAGIAVPVPAWNLIKNWFKPWLWRITRYDLAMLVYTLKDPLPFFREILRMDRENLWIDLKTKEPGNMYSENPFPYHGILNDRQKPVDLCT